MGRKLLICTAALMLITGNWLWNYFDYGYPPSDHPAYTSIDFENILIDNGTHGMLIFKSTNVLTTRDGYYIFNLERQAKDSFTGRVMIYEKIHENIPVTRDVLSAKSFFANPEKVEWSLQNHRFQWRAKSNDLARLGILLRYYFPYHLIPYRPYHLIPGNTEIARIIDTIEVGDRLTIKGFDVSSFKVNATNPRAGIWADAGCRTMIVTEIEIS